MLRIRLARVGKKKQPAYRIVVADSRAPREGAFIKIIGHYNPLTEPATVVVKEDEAVHWLQKGAQPSETAAKLLSRAGVMEKAGLAPVKYAGKQVPPGRRGKRGDKVEQPPAPAPAAAAPAATPEPAAAAETAAEPEATAEPEAAAEPEVAAEPEAAASAETTDAESTE